MEAYPSLQGDERVADLSEELTSTENRIAFARQAHNDYVTVFNSYRRAFPNCAVGMLFGFPETRDLLTFPKSEALTVAPQVTLT